jgi:signal transduction histidine kinase
MVDLLFVGRVVSAVSGIVLLGLAAWAVTDREKPAAQSFGILLGVLGVAAVCGAATAHTGTLYKLVWLVTTLTIPVSFAVFAFDYYGLTYFETRGRLLGALTPAVIGIAGGTLVILGTPGEAGASAPLATLAGLPGPLFEAAATFQEVGIYYTTGLILLAVGLVLLTVYRYHHLDSRLGPVVAFLGGWPWFAYLVMPELIGTIPTDVVLLGVTSGYAGSVLAATLAVGPLGLFASTPAAGNVGPKTVLDSMDDAVLVVDGEGTILRLNAVACKTFETTPENAVGGPLTGVVGQAVDGLPDEETVALDTVEGSRQFEVSHTSVTDRTDDERGSALVLRDVTRRQTREQRLDVLNRVLRHNLRNDATSIIGRAQLISDGGEIDDSAERIVETTTDLVSTAERAREIERMMDGSGTETADLAADVDRAVESVEATEGVEVTTALPEDVTAAVDPTVLETVLTNLLDNAAEHNDAGEPLVVLSGDVDGDTLSIAVADNGPGIPDHEQQVLEAGEESALEHGSGLGLWAVHWGVTRMGGDLAFAENDPRGSIVTVSIPVERATARTEDVPAEA